MYTYTVCSLLKAPLVVTQKLPVSTLLKVEYRPEFAQDHESGLRSYRGPVVLCDLSKLLVWKSPYEFLNLYGRFCPYNPPYNPRHDTLSANMHIEIFTQRKKIRRIKSIEFIKLYRLTSRKPGLKISFRMQIWGQWVNKNDFSLISERTVAQLACARPHRCIDCNQPSVTHISLSEPRLSRLQGCGPGPCAAGRSRRGDARRCVLVGRPGACGCVAAG
jgi:hypothetical protein